MSLHPVVKGVVDGLPGRARWHIRGRARSFPLHALTRRVPAAGRVLEVGCGHGLVAATLALESGSREVVGVDIDPAKIEVAALLAAAVTASGGRLDVAPSDGRHLPPGPWDAIVIADVLYLLAPAQQEALVARCAAALRGGGVLVVKELHDRPRAKFAFARLEELMATRVLRITTGDDLHWRPAAGWATLMTGAGLSADIERIDRGYPYPHVLVTGRAGAMAPVVIDQQAHPRPA